MKCRFCDKEFDDDEPYCPYCLGNNKVECCRNCGNKVEVEDTYCRHCGTKLKTEAIVFDNTVFFNMNDEPVDIEREPLDTKKKGYKNPAIWFLSFILLLLALASESYIGVTSKKQHMQRGVEKESISNSNISRFTLEKETHGFAQQQNINSGGYITRDKDSFYLSTEEGIIRYNARFKKQEKFVDQAVMYVNVDDTYIYYADNDYNYYRMHRKTKKKELLLKDIYYPQLVNGKLYYQNNGDQESIHVFDLKTSEDKKLNSLHSYDMYIDEENHSIYYYCGEDNPGVIGLYRMDTDGQNNTRLTTEGVSTFFYDGKQIHYSTKEGTFTYDIQSKQIQDIGVSYAGLYKINNHFVVWDQYNKISILDKQKEKVVFNQRVDKIQSIGNVLLCWISSWQSSEVYVLDLDGNCASLAKDTRKPFNIQDGKLRESDI